MFQIDSSSIDAVDKIASGECDFEKQNNHFSTFIVNKINQHKCNQSGCFSCFSNFESKVAIDPRNIVEVECNGLLSNCFCELKDCKEELFPQDFVIVTEAENTEVAQVKHVGQIVSIKRHSLGLFGEELPTIIRKTTKEDLEKVRRNLRDECRAVPFFKKSVAKLNLVMKLVAVHYQFDRKKLFFFYTADGRVDFRELAKELAAEFKTRIELRQIGVRDEAKKIGGIGICGREYCCITFLSNFKRINAQLPIDQNLLTNLAKLNGPCNKLKCCFSFELE